MKVNLPHGPSFWLVDSIQHITNEPDFVESTYTFTGKEEWKAEDHFPGNPLMPGVIMLEAMAQNTIQIAQRKPGLENKIFLVTGIKSEISHSVKPNTEITLRASIEWTEKFRKGIARCSAHHGDTLIAVADINFVVISKKSTKVST